MQTSFVWASVGFFGSANIPQRPAFQRAVINNVGSLQDRVRRRGQAHAGRGWNPQTGSWRSQSESVQALPDRVILHEELQRLTGAVNEFIHLKWRNKRGCMCHYSQNSFDFSTSTVAAGGRPGVRPEEFVWFQAESDPITPESWWSFTHTSYRGNGIK